MWKRFSKEKASSTNINNPSLLRNEKKEKKKTTNSTRERRGERDLRNLFSPRQSRGRRNTDPSNPPANPALQPFVEGGNIGEKKAFPLLLPLEEKVERGDDGERVKRWRRLCKGCAGPRLLGFARRFAYRFSGAVSYGGNRRTISLNFAGGTGYDISLVATFKHACFTRAIFLCIYTCVCVYLWLGLYRVSIVGNCNWIPPFFRKMVN